jgi:hypothetical protein
MNFCCDKSLYKEWGSSKERTGIVWLLAEMWQLKGIRRNTDKGRYPLRIGAEDVIHILRDCSETRHWKTKFLNDVLLNMNKEVAYRKILRFSNKDKINLGRYLDRMKYKWFNRTK